MKENVVVSTIHYSDDYLRDSSGVPKDILRYNKNLK